MADTIAEIVAGLDRLDRVHGVWELAERRLRDSDASFVGGLGAALAQRYGGERMPSWQYRSVYDHLLRLLTLTPGRANVEQALRMTDGGARSARYLASLLASGQTVENLHVVFSGGGSHGASEGLRACLVHELVLRGVNVTDYRWATSSHWHGHPLGWLPLTLTSLETAVPLPSYSLTGTAYGTLPVPTGDRENVGGTPPTATETTSEATASGIAAAVANWAAESNGRIEARTFEFADPVDSVPTALLHLGLACLGGRPRVDVFTCSPATAWQSLFTAASTGGAYNNGEYGAHGRLAAWRSVAGLTGAPDAAADEVERLAHGSAWYTFDAPAWFEHVAWDLGLVAVAPDRRRLAVLAATDTD